MSVILNGDVLNFRGDFRPQHVKDFNACVNRYWESKPEKLILNFAKCTNAFPNSILPVIATMSRFRRLNYNIYVLLPDDQRLHDRFREYNWAHYLSPTQYPLSDDLEDPHLVTRHFRSNKDHHAITDGMIDLLMKKLNSPRSALQMLYWVMNELMDNVVNHSESIDGGYVQMAIFPPTSKIALCVVDCGKGIKESLRGTYPQLTSDRLAIQEAVKAGITRDKNFGQGNGLSGSLSLAIATHGRFSVASGISEVQWLQTEPNVQEFEQESEYYGTLVDIQLPYNQEIDFVKLLSAASHSPYYVNLDFDGTDFIDTKYMQDENSTYVRMVEEINNLGFGSRSIGADMNSKIKFLLKNSNGLPCVIDWKDVEMIISSYADEFIGKLFVELGPITFMSKVSLINMSPVVKAIINKAILQRTSQAMS